MKHLFLHHSISDITVAYKKPYHALISATHYERIRNGVFKKIEEDRFDQELEKILSKKI